MRRIVLYFLWLGIFSLAACNKEESSKLTVLSSIKPVQAIVLAIAGENITSQQLIPDSASPHHYAFKPSDLRKVAEADLIFRIDEHFEALLNPVLKGLSKQSKTVSLSKSPGIKLLPLGGNHSHDEHDEDRAFDMHIFTSPENVIVMAKAIAEALSKLDPNNAQNYQDNAEKFTNNVRQTSTKVRLELAPLSDKPYVVFHSSWQYFSTYFGLQSPKVVSLQEGIIAGGKTIKKIRDEIASERIQCVFKGPDISSSRVNVLTENMHGLSIKSVEIDVLGRDIAISEDSYIKWLEYMGSQVKNCLTD